MIASVTVFCGSSDAVDSKYFTAAAELGEKIARRGWRITYGGGGVGLMGALARAALGQGGHVIGVIPRALLDLGVGETKVSELVVTDGLRDRKAIMDEGKGPKGRQTSTGAGTCAIRPQSAATTSSIW